MGHDEENREGKAPQSGLKGNIHPIPRLFGQGAQGQGTAQPAPGQGQKYPINVAVMPALGADPGATGQLVKPPGPTRHNQSAAHQEGRRGHQEQQPSPAHGQSCR